MLQLILHLFGDYVTQSDWMALNKRKSSVAAFSHALVYSLPFLLLTRRAPAPALAGAFILVSHFLMDRFGLARYVVWAKNWLAPERPSPWNVCSGTGYDPERPAWMAVWLMIAADNTIHLLCNYIALRWM